jgi:hypothetical protein
LPIRLPVEEVERRRRSPLQVIVDDVSSTRLVRAEARERAGKLTCRECAGPPIKPDRAPARNSREI